MCRQGRWDALQAAMWIHRHLIALISDAGDLDADTLDTKYREMTAAMAACGSVGEIRAALNMDPLVHGPASVKTGGLPS
jgi:hypothetical protein